MTTTRLAIFSAALFALLAGSGLTAAESKIPSTDAYEPGPDSKPQAGVPKGKTFSFPLAESKIFPGTTRTITVYVPAQYKGDQPACLYVGLDGLGFSATTVFDNLIAKGEMPVTIAVGVAPGTAASLRDKENPRFNRSFEFDGLNDGLARCLLEEILPAVEKRQTPDGRPIRLSPKASDRCTGGGSTGGIGAFTLAWERPDQFSRVFTAIGTFVGMRGGDRYAVLVRKTEAKPIRVFMQDGSNDEWMGGPEVGDWWMSNQTLQRALEFSGYEQEHVWGTGIHSARHATAIFPDAMRYLWKDWPQPVQTHSDRTQNVFLKAVLDPTATWQAVAGAGDTCDRLAANPQGEVYASGSAAGGVWKVELPGTAVQSPDVPPGRAFSFDARGQAITAPAGIEATCLTTLGNGVSYATERATGKVWLIKPDGTKSLLDEGLKEPTGIAVSPDGLWLAVMERATHWGYSYRVKADATVEWKQRFYWAHEPDWADESGAGSACMDRDGRLYVTTHLGVQIFDRNGRSRGILTAPARGATSVCFGGANFDTLFITSGGKVYRKHLKAIGAPAFRPPFTLPPWGAG